MRLRNLRPTVRKNGQSLLEVLVTLAVVLLVVTALVWATTIALRNADFAKKKSQAAKYSQEGMENIRAFRDIGWTTFWSAADSVNRALSGSTPSGNCPLTPNIPSSNPFFIRCVKLEQIVNSDPRLNKVKATVTVSWTDSSGIHKSEPISYFTRWE